MNLLHLRATGRTTRMIEHAKQLDREGRAVYILADNTREVHRIEILLGREKGGIKVETPETVGNLDWTTMRLRNGHPNHVVLVDNHTIEDRFSRVIQMLHAYDVPTSAAIKREFKAQRKALKKSKDAMLLYTRSFSTGFPSSNVIVQAQNEALAAIEKVQPNKKAGEAPPRVRRLARNMVRPREKGKSLPALVRREVGKRVLRNWREAFEAAGREHGKTDEGSSTAKYANKT